MKNVLVLEDHPNFKYATVPENYNDKTERKVRVTRWFKSDLEYIQFAVAGLNDNVFFSTGEIEEYPEENITNIKYDFYKRTKNTDNYNGATEYIYDRTE